VVLIPLKVIKVNQLSKLRISVVWANPSTAFQVGLYALAFSKLKFVKELKQSFHPFCEIGSFNFSPETVIITLNFFSTDAQI